MDLRILRTKQLGQGGQGSVWEGKVQETGRKVAIKYLDIDKDSTHFPEARQRFLREMRCQTELKHTNIVRIIAANIDADPPFYVMGWADESLEDRLRSFPDGMEEEYALSIFMKVLSAMEFAHSEGVLHRDLKPGNVLFFGGEPQVSDFGYSRRIFSGSATLTRSLSKFGTVAYSAPEQFKDVHKSDERSDIYALGKIFYHLITGDIPFPAVDASIVPGKFRYVIQKCTDNSPEKRYQSVSDLARELTLLSVEAEGLAGPHDRAKALLEKMASGDNDSAEKLLQLLFSNQNDVNLYTDFVPYLNREALIELEHFSAPTYESIIENFCHLMQGSHPFSYTDVIGDFLATVYECTNDISIQRLALTRIVTVGAYHNRFHLGGLFARLVGYSKEDQAKVLMIRDVLKENPGEAYFFASYLENMSLPEQIKNALPS